MVRPSTDARKPVTVRCPSSLEDRLHAAELRLEPVCGVPGGEQVLRDGVGEEVDARALPERVARARRLVPEVLADEVEEAVEVEAARGVRVPALGETARKVGAIGRHGPCQEITPGADPGSPGSPDIPLRRAAAQRGRSGPLAPAR